MGTATDRESRVRRIVLTGVFVVGGLILLICIAVLVIGSIYGFQNVFYFPHMQCMRQFHDLDTCSPLIPRFLG